MTTIASPLADVWPTLRPVELAEVNAAAGLARRIDTKYLVTAPALVGVVDALRDTYRCLEVDGGRSFTYLSRYLDTPTLGCFHDHRRGVRKRWKARVRVYEESGLARFEVKVKDGRGRTVKHALTLDRDPGPALTRAMRDFLREVIATSYQQEPPADLVTTLSSRYRRTTLVDLAAGARLTLDSDLELATRRGHATLRPGRWVVETKSATGRSPADAVLRAAGSRPVAVSKYCAGVALLDPALPDHPWRRLLNQHFDRPDNFEATATATGIGRRTVATVADPGDRPAHDLGVVA